MEREHLVGQRADVLPLLVDRIESRPDEIPCLREHLTTTASQGSRMLVANHDTIGIVVEHDVVRAPGDEHRVPGAQYDSHARPERQGPLLHGTERGLRPVDGAHSCTHVAAFGKHGIAQARLAEIHCRSLTTDRDRGDADDSPGGAFALNQDSSATVLLRRIFLTTRLMAPRLA